jgi:RNA polymerase sigma-70 factor (ECF subfamily)
MSLAAAAPDDRDDASLVGAYERGETGAFDALYARYGPRVTTYAARLLGRREEGEEVATEVFVRVVEGRWRPTGTFRSWLFTLTHRMCLDRLRARERRRRLLSWFGRGEAPVTPEDALVVGERDRALQAAIGRLPAEHRAALLLATTEGLTSPEIAAVLGTTDQQVRSKLSYARRLLREALEERHDR